MNDFDFGLPFPDVFPKEWDGIVGPRDYVAFRNLEHFKHYVSKITQKADDNCGVTYKQSLEDLINGKSDIEAEKKDYVRNLVRSNLLKRGLITAEVYENFRYTTDGTKVDVDVGKMMTGEPDCVMSPSVQYIDYFYELYISISYPWNVSNESVTENVTKLLSTIEELERQHIFIKITLVFPARDCARDGEGGYKNLFSVIPLFSHKTPKSVELMSSVVNNRLLRKFYFAVMENIYGSNLLNHYGSVIKLPKCMCIGDKFNEIKFFEEVMEMVGKPKHSI